MYKPNRLSAFSDSVISIAITLLVLGLEVPSVHEVTEHQLPKYLLESLHPLYGYICSFILIGTYWLQHYVVFHYVTQVNRTFVILNGVFLLTISFVPFPTGLQAAYRHDQLAIVVYAASQIACGLSLLALWIYATTHHRLVPTSVLPQVIASMTKRIALTPIVGIAAIAVSFFSVDLSRVMFLAIPIIYVSHRTVDRGWVEA